MNAATTWDGSSSNWVGTLSGRRMDLVRPDPAQISLDDIAHALGNQCRYTGHVRHHYSVAEHCIHVADLVPPHLRLAALLHDAQEAYIADMSTPMKAEIGQGYRDIEDRIVRALDAHFGMDGQLIRLPEEVKTADRMMLMTERDALIDAYEHWGEHFESTPRHTGFMARYLDNPAGAREAYKALVLHELRLRDLQRAADLARRV